MNRLWKCLVLVVLQMSAFLCWAGNGQMYSREKVESLQAANKPFVIHVHAGWCRTCKAQSPIVDALLADPSFAQVVLLTVDFDTQKDVLRQLDVIKQSTLIAFKGKVERGRSIGDTSEAGIRDLLSRSVKP